MPKPKKGESKQDYLGRCTQALIEKEGKEPDQAFATCNAYWDDSKSQRSAMNLTAPLVLAPAGEPHGVANRSGDPLTLLVFMAPPPAHAAPPGGLTTDRVGG